MKLKDAVLHRIAVAAHRLMDGDRVRWWTLPAITATRDEVALNTTPGHGPGGRTGRRVLLVLGMHRGGTSALSGLTARLGACAPRTPIPADSANPLGYWESRPFMDFNERLLQNAQTAWDSWDCVSQAALDSLNASGFLQEFGTLVTEEFGDSPLFVLKDPRICRLVPVYREFLHRHEISAAAVIVVRNPFEVSASLSARDGITCDHALLMWLRHMLDAESDSRGMVRSVVRYQDLLDDWKAVADKLSSDLDVQWPVSASRGSSTVEDFLCRDYHHHRAAPPHRLTGQPLEDWLSRTWAALGALRDEGDEASHEAYAELNVVRAEFNRACTLGRFVASIKSDSLVDQSFTSLKRCSNAECTARAGQAYASYTESVEHCLSCRNTELESQLAVAIREADALRKHASALETSKVWRWTAPARHIWTLLHKALGGIR